VINNRNLWIFSAILSLLMNPFHQALAGDIGPVKTKGFDVYVPNLPASNTFTAGAIFLRPGGSNDFAVLVNPFNPNVATPMLSPSWEPTGIRADFSTGFSLNFRHVFPDSGSDVDFYWAHLRTSDNATFPVNRELPPALQMTGPVWDIGPNAGTTSAAKGQLKDNYDVFHAEIGKAVNFDPNLKSRFFAGVSGLWLKQKITTNFSGVDPILGLYTFGTETQSQYNAAGVRLGVDGEYEGKYNINLLGLLAGSVYIGSQQPRTNTVGVGSVLADAGIPENHQWISHNSYIQVVPALDTKLGLKYSKTYKNKLAAIEAGYMASIYVNALQNYSPSTLVPGSLGIVSGSVFLQSLIKTTDSFSVDGPYVVASLKI